MRGGDLPTAIFGVAEKGGEAAIGIKTRQAQPVYRAVAPDKRGRLAIAYQSVIFNRKRHG